MLALEVTTRKKPEKIIKKLKDYFGSTGLNMDLVRDKDSSLLFKGDGGYVEAKILSENGQTTVSLETREWDHHLRKFADGL